MDKFHRLVEHVYCYYISYYCINIFYAYELVSYLRYKPKTVNNESQALTPGEDLTSDYMNILGMILSMCGLLMKVKKIYNFSIVSRFHVIFFQFKWAAWCAMFCSCISFANSKASDDNKQIFSSFM